LGLRKSVLCSGKWRSKCELTVHSRAFVARGPGWRIGIDDDVVSVIDNGILICATVVQEGRSNVDLR